MDSTTALRADEQITTKARRNVGFDGLGARYLGFVKYSAGRAPRQNTFGIEGIMKFIPDTVLRSLNRDLPVGNYPHAIPISCLFILILTLGFCATPVMASSPSHNCSLDDSQYFTLHDELLHNAPAGLNALNALVFTSGNDGCAWRLSDVLIPLAGNPTAASILRNAGIVDYAANWGSFDASLLMPVAAIYFPSAADNRVNFASGVGAQIVNWFSGIEQNIPDPTQLDQFEDRLLNIYYPGGIYGPAPTNPVIKPFIVYTQRRPDNIPRIVQKIISKNNGSWGGDRHGSGAYGFVAADRAINIDPVNSTVSYLQWWADRSNHPVAPMILWVNVIFNHYDQIMSAPNDAKARIITLINAAVMTTLDMDSCLNGGDWADLVHRMGGLLKPSLASMKAVATRPHPSGCPASFADLADYVQQH